ncbi:MAG: RnfABCDGE type electron transport complex subunit G [Acidobacteriota bacterium]|jgi:electron transport complex protein RnfG|nr:RnfABCDGE type electron transport complex subunit G [Acidobacteriota bacterium]
MAERKKLPSTFFNMVAVLTLVCVVSALALGFTYSKTKDAIAQGRINKIIEALRIVLPEFDNNPYEERFTRESAPGLIFYPAQRDGKRVGTAVQTYSSEGFGSEDIRLMVGFDAMGRIISVSVLGQAETPGLGTKMEEPSFRDQFRDKDPSAFKLSVKQDGGDVDAITAATISSRAFCDGVNKAYSALMQEAQQ